MAPPAFSFVLEDPSAKRKRGRPTGPTKVASGSTPSPEPPRKKVQTHSRLTLPHTSHPLPVTSPTDTDEDLNPLPDNTTPTLPSATEIDPDQLIVEEPEEFGGEGEGMEEETIDEENATQPPTANQSARSSIPPYVHTQFLYNKEKYLVRGPDGLPLLYSTHHTFWVPQKSPILRSPLSSSITPEEFFNPHFFIWDFLPLIPSMCCPKVGCQGVLCRRGYRERPRRVVDMNDCYWLMGARYSCQTCRSSFSSWDSSLLEKLAKNHPDLAAEFPAYLTHRSGIDKRLFIFMSTCFSSGMGPKQFSDALRVQHKERFDFLHLQYLQAIYNGGSFHKWQNLTFRPFGTFNGAYCGFVPSASWLRDLWDDRIEAQSPEIEQYTSMLPLRILGMDHSHQVRYSMFLSYW